MAVKWKNFVSKCQDKKYIMEGFLTGMNNLFMRLRKIVKVYWIFFLLFMSVFQAISSYNIVLNLFGNKFWTKKCYLLDFPDLASFTKDSQMTVEMAANICVKYCYTRIVLISDDL